VTREDVTIEHYKMGHRGKRNWRTNTRRWSDEKTIELNHHLRYMLNWDIYKTMNWREI